MSIPLSQKLSSFARVLGTVAILILPAQIVSAAPKLKAIAVSGNLNFSNVLVGSSAQLSMTISNAGATTLSVSSISLPAGFSTTFTTASIPVRGTATAFIKFSPTAAQSYSGTATVNSSATSGTKSLPVSGAGVGPTIALAGNLNFGTVSVNSNAQKVLTISNTGTTNLTVASISYPPGFSGSFSGKIAPGAFTNVQVTFSPTAATNYGGTITVNSDKLAGTNTITASGTGLTTGGIIALSGNLSFGNLQINSSAQSTLVISNLGNAALTVSNVTYPSGFSGSFAGVIAPGKSTNVTVTFSPTAGITYSGSVAVKSDATAGANTIAISGTGVGGRIALSGNLSFGNVSANTISQSTLVISNSGAGILNVSSISFPAGFSGNFSGAIAAGQTANVTVTFSPTAATTYGGPIAVNSDALSGTSTIQTSGTGVHPRIVVSGNLNFGNVLVNTSVQHTLVISNSGSGILMVTNINYPLGFSGSFAGALAPHTTTNVAVTFNPMDTVNYSGAVAVVSDAFSGTSTNAASGVGIAPVIAVSGNLSFGSVIVGLSGQSTLNIANTGGVTLNVSSIDYPLGFSGDFAGAIAPGGSTNVTVTFTPTNAAPYGGTITVNSDAFKGTNQVNVSATGIDPTRIISLSGDLNFGAIFVGSTAHLTLILTNSGNSDLTFTNIMLPAQYVASITSGVLAPGATTNVDVAFTPPDTNSFNGIVTVVSDATSGLNTANVTGAGTNVANPVIVLGGDLNFGDVMVGTSANLNLVISNSGNATLTVSSIYCPLGFSSTFGGTIEPGTATNAVVTFSPSTPLLYDEQLTVISDAASGANTFNASGDAFHHVATKAGLNGLFYPSNNVAFANSGYFTAKETSKNTFSAKVQLGSKKYSLSGKFSPTGSFSRQIKRKGTSNLTVTVQAGFDGNTLWKGTITDGAFIADLVAVRTVITGKTNPAPEMGIYTFTIAGSASSPVLTNGMGTLTVTKSGVAKVKAVLGDGRKMTQATTVGQNGQLPLFGLLYSKKGSILGWQTCGNVVGNELNGTVDWFKPAGLETNNPNGFSFTTTLTGAKQ
jgi:hypothetical protein